ncbi:Putative uncharacterized protein [Escherichia coli D6-117.29]|nr:Protein of unknown function [Escherichia coli]CDP78067.1 Putative uncharacterized protein [Escherichia coli D6-117.29]CDU40578.1 Protein of unknown function [Escherichia coli]
MQQEYADMKVNAKDNLFA